MAILGRAQPVNRKPPKPPKGVATAVNYYVDTASTGGNGTTPATSGANAAFASLSVALSTLGATNWDALNQRPIINCGGTTADTVAPAVGSAWVGKLSPTCYLTITTNQPDALTVSTAAYRLTGAQNVGLYNTSANARYLRVVKLHAVVTVGTGTFGWGVYGTDSPGTDPGNIDIRYDSCRIEVTSISGTHSGDGTAFWSSLSGASNRIIYTNCVAIGQIVAGTGSHAGWRYPGGCPVYCYNCEAYNWDIGFGGDSPSTTPVLKNCGTAACTDGYNGTFNAASTNNASSIAADAPGSNPRNSVTPSFVSAPSNLHLADNDTAWKDQGADLSNDPVLAITTDGDGLARSGTFDIGADEVTIVSLVTTKGAASAVGTAGATLALGTATPVAVVAAASAVGPAGSTLSLGAISPIATVAPASAVGQAGSTLSLGALSITSVVAPVSAAGISSTLSLGALTVTSVVAPASATGIAGTLFLQITITAVVAPASAVGISAVASADSVTLPATVAPASASGLTALLDQVLTLTATVGPATAAGISATLNMPTGMVGTVAPASAVAAAASLTNALVLTATVGQAAAAAQPASWIFVLMNLTPTRAIAFSLAPSALLNMGTLVVTGAPALAGASAQPGSLPLGGTAIPATVAAAAASAIPGVILADTITINAVVAAAASAGLAASLSGVLSLITTRGTASAVGRSATLNIGAAFMTLIGTRAPAYAYGHPAVFAFDLPGIRMVANIDVRPRITGITALGGRLVATLTVMQHFAATADARGRMDADPNVTPATTGTADLTPED